MSQCRQLEAIPEMVYGCSGKADGFRGELWACSCSWGWLGTVSAALGQAAGLEPTAVPYQQAEGDAPCAPWQPGLH